MSQRHSSYARVPGEKYYSPAWVPCCVAPHIPPGVIVFDPCCGEGAIVKALSDRFVAHGRDLDQGYDFLKDAERYQAVVTNPPFAIARQFIEHALAHADFVAMLLRIDYDSAATRQHLFRDCPRFSKKIVLTKRIVWFERPGAAPSFNHCWMIWDSEHRGAPTLAYAP